MVRGYVHITDDPVRRAPKRNLVATCYRTHGDDFLPLVERLFSSTGTATNLLGTIRCLDHMEAVRLLGAALADEIDDQETGVGAAEPWLPDLPPTTEGATFVGPGPTQRLEPHPVDPDAGFFSDDEVGTRARSRTAEALSR